MEERDHREQFRPTVGQLLRGALNILIWKLPVPCRLRGWLSGCLYRSPEFSAKLVKTVVDALNEEGIDFWICGGWGVDALLGEQSRRHDDLDLIVSRDSLEPAIAKLAQLGFSSWYETRSEVMLGSRVVLRDHPIAGRVVDLHPIGAERNRLAFDWGTVAGTRVPCLDLGCQIDLHEGYSNKSPRRLRQDRADRRTLYRLKSRQRAVSRRR